ncbi:MULTISPECIES: hypothetical protein [Clostridia]|uniref:LpxL/LpxP family acyltransferase n=1 Tax=Clostridia TaxID=186801 RepID=UPI000EA2B192|nr:MULTISPECIES: hypothetical protein [Clostridia]NBJ68086.1 hypothetical protein [Roseburia sp. 1XD42-34]RKI81862.1 hypothetical protein D7V87_01160 [Clostridium sp. 1xD42-85]
MSILNFNNLLQFQSIWKSIPFYTKEDQELAYRFFKNIVEEELELTREQLEKQQQKYLKVINTFPKLKPLAEEVSHAYSLFVEKRKSAWTYLSLALYSKQYDRIINQDSDRLLQTMKKPDSKNRIILAPFHMGMHTMSMPLITRFFDNTTILVNSDEIDIIYQWMSTYLDETFNTSITMVPVPSHTSPLRFSKAIMRGAVGIIFPEFSYGINQEEEEVRFLGGTFKAPIGVYVLAKRLSAKVYPIGSIWNEDEQNVQFMVGDVLDPNILSQSTFIQKLFTQGEEWIMKHPEQWLWDHLID